MAKEAGGKKAHLRTLFVAEASNGSPEVSDDGVRSTVADKVGVTAPFICAKREISACVQGREEERKECAPTSISGKPEMRSSSSRSLKIWRMSVGKEQGGGQHCSGRQGRERRGRTGKKRAEVKGREGRNSSEGKKRTSGDNLIEPVQDSVHLLLDLDRETLVGDEADVFGLVLVCHRDVTTAGNEVRDLDDAELFALDGEGEVEDAVDVVGECPLERLVVLRVDRLEVAVVDGLAEHVLVDGTGEVGFEDALVVNGFADDATNEAEVEEVVVVDAGGLREGRRLVVVDAEEEKRERTLLGW